MTTLQFLAEWALRSSILILSGALLLWAARVKDASVRLMAWTAMLAGSLAIPALTAALPSVPLAVMRVDTRPVEPPPAVDIGAPDPVGAVPVIPRRFDWPRVIVTMYVLVALALLLRLCIGLAMSRRLLRGSRATERTTEGIEIRESDGVAAPVTLGIARPAIVLPRDWREWDAAKLDAVLAHERSHIRRHDPAVQLVSAIHRALLWHSPLSWFLHRRIVRVAEEASDDAAMAVVHNRALYAEVLLEFMQRGVRGVNWLGVPMARYGRAEKRIHRILDGTSLSHGVTRWAVASIVALGFPLAWVVATARPSQAAPQAAARTASPPVQTAPQANPLKPPPTVARKQQAAPAYLTGLGNVAATTVTVASKVDGELKFLGFEEGKPVEAGQLLASIDSHNGQTQLERALKDLARDKQRFAASAGQPASVVLELENQVNTDQREVDNLTAEVVYGQVRAPLAGMAGFRKVDPGNYVHAGDILVVLTQMQPTAVVFTIPEDALPQVLARVRDGASLPVEAWNRDHTVRLATGRLTAVDNQIDEKTGMAKLKAIFDNKDGALFPNQFVSVSLLMNTR